MSDGGQPQSGAGGPGPSPPAAWYPDPWTPARRRYWNGSSWTFATTDVARPDDPPPPDTSPLPEGHGLPDPVVRRPAAAAPEGASGASGKPPQRPVKWALAVVVGLLVGFAALALGDGSPSRPATPDGSAAGSAPRDLPATSVPKPDPAPLNNDPSAAALAALVVKEGDVPASVRVVVFPGGIGLTQPTLDLCNGRYPSESRRTARIQDAVVDTQGNVLLSTEAVLYVDSAATTQAFSELASVVAACPPTPVQSPVGQPTVVTRFAGAPDTTWPETPSVNRLAFDFTTDDGTGRPRRAVAVYLQRGRALLGVYFAQPDGPQVAVEGQTTIEGIVALFAARLAALPASVVGT